MRRAVVVLAALIALLAPRARAEAPSIGGTCRPCPEIDFGPFTVSPAWQTHAGQLTSVTDCAWYGLEVAAGSSYEFATCAPGSATFDTVLELFGGDCSLLATNDDGCAPQSRLRWAARVAGTVLLKVRGFGGGSGSYVLAWRQTGAPCTTCAAAGAAPLTPTVPCGTVWGAPDTCLGGWHSFSLTAGNTYSFATCSSMPCTLGYGDVDLLLGLFDPSCRLVASDDNSCGGVQPLLTYLVPAGASGTYRVRVQGRTQPGNYALTYREGTGNCIEPGFVTIQPLQASADALSCARTQVVTLTAAAAATPPINYTWQVTPAAGGVAVPSHGTVTSLAMGGLATFTVRLSGQGAHRIDVVATSTCGTASAAQDLLLNDVTPPLVLPPPSRTVECPGPPPVEAPRVRDSCDPSPAVRFSESTIPGRCPAESVIRREWVATDASGNTSAAARQVIVVRDTTPPVITPDASVHACAYPPDHGRACFGLADFAPAVTDACAGSTTWRFARVTHDEWALGACDPPDAEPDVELAQDGTTFCVRAERCIDDSAVSPGRSYLVEAIAVDACGNASAPVPIGVVLIPQDGTDTSSCVVPEPW